MEAKALRNAKMIVVPSQRLAGELCYFYPELRNKRIAVIPNPVDTGRFLRPSGFDATRIRRELGISEQDLAVVFVALGNFHHKGLAILLKSLARLNTASVILTVVGGTWDEIGSFRKLAASLGVADVVKFVGFRADIRPYLWSSDLFALPSQGEAFSLAALQAAAAGLPIIATKVGAIEDFVEHDVNGWLVERNVESVSEALRKAMNLKNLLPDMGKKAREAARRFDVMEFRKRWRELIMDARWQTL